MGDIYFTEKQRFRELAFFVLMALIQLLFLWGLVSQVIFGIPWGTKPASNAVLISINIFVALVFLFLFSVSLKTEINSESFRFRMFPFHFRYRKFQWDEIESIKLIKYNGIRDYLGYGFRYSPKKGWCYTISGDQGIKITLKNGKVMLVGTHKTLEINEVLKLLKKGKSEE